MPKETLTKAWIYNGKFYGPGEADLPDDAHAALKAKGAFEAPEAAPDEAPASPDPLADFPELRAAGYDSVELVRLATDNDLLAVEGIGPATLKKIRAATQE